MPLESRRVLSAVATLALTISRGECFVPAALRTCTAWQRGAWALRAAELIEVPESMENEVFVLREYGTSKYIEVFADVLAKVDGQEYLIGHPCDWAVSIGKPNAKGGMRPVPIDSEEMDDIFGPLETMLEEDDIHLMRSAVTLTLQGEFLDDDAEEVDDDDDDYEDDEDDEEDDQYDWRDDFEIIEEGDGEDIIDGTEDDDDEDEREPTDVSDESADLIASFWHEKQEYCLVRLLNPIWLIAKKGKKVAGMDYYYLLGEEEAAKINPLVESLMLEQSSKRLQEEGMQEQ